MFATMALAALIAVVYCVLIARHLRAARAAPPAQRADPEAAAVRALLDGTTTRAAYRAAMESAAREYGQPLRVPE